MQRHIRTASALRLDVIHGSAHLDGVAFRQDSEAQSQILRELTDLGVDSIHIAPGRHAPRAPGALGIPLAAEGRADRRADRRAADGAPDSAHQPRPARAARHALEDRAVARRADRAARSVVRAVTRADRAHVRRRDVGQGRRPRDDPRRRHAADSEGRGEQRRARPDPGGEALREPDLLPFGERRDAQPADRQTDRVRPRGDRGARRSGAPARHRQDPHPARDSQEAERARQARAQDDGGAHDATAPRSWWKWRGCGR